MSTTAPFSASHCRPAPGERLPQPDAAFDAGQYLAEVDRATTHRWWESPPLPAAQLHRPSRFTHPLAHPTPTAYPRCNRTRALTATSVAAVAVAFAVYISKPSTFTLSGTLTIKQSSNKQSSNGGLIAGTRRDCQGASGLADLSAGTAVIVKDPEGRQVAVGVLQTGSSPPGNKNWCVLTFSVPDLPGGLSLYSVTISNRGTEVFTPEEAATGCGAGVRALRVKSP